MAFLYLMLLSGAEALTVFAEPWTGVVLYSALLMALLLHAALIWEQPFARLLVTLAFVPLIRLLSVSLPFAGLPQIYWYLITSVPLMATVVVFVRTFGIPWREVGLNLRGLPLQMAVILSGIALGYVEYIILRPKPLVESLTMEQVWLPALILLVCTGFVEEIIFRGLMQRTAMAVLGRPGILYVATIFAVLHLGYLSLADFVFVFAVAVYFGWVVARTGSILGVTGAHGLTNILLFLVMPFVPLGDLPSVSLPPITTTAQQSGTVNTPAPLVVIEATATRGFPTPQDGVQAVTGPAAPLVNLPTPVPTVPSSPAPILATPTPLPTASAITPQAHGASPTVLRQVETVRPRAVVITPGLNVRVGPGIEYAVVTIVIQGDELDIVGRNTTGSSLLVSRVPRVGVGWVWSGGVEFTTSIDDLPVVGTR